MGFFSVPTVCICNNEEFNSVDMYAALAKFLILWIICENVLLAASMALIETDNADSTTRQKRSPDNKFSLFGFNLEKTILSAKETVGGIRNIFSANHGNAHNYKNRERTETYGMARNPHMDSRVDIPNRSSIPHFMTQNDFQKGDRYVQPQQNKNETFVKSSVIKVPEINNRASENTGDNPENEEIDQQLLDYIFQKSQFNYDGAGTSTVDNNIDFVTETGEYETTTGLDNRVAPELLASLLG